MNPVLALALAGVGALLWVALRRSLPSVTPRIRRSAGYGLLGLAVLIAVSRQFGLAAAVAGFAIALLAPGLATGSSTPSPGGISEVETESLRMTLDHETGAMEGEVVDGPLAGRSLSELDPAELATLLDQLETDDESLQLLLTWLERSGREPRRPAAPDAEPMSEAEAWRVLGLEPGASREEIRAAHRRLIRKVHPDLGGSAALTAMINAAKDRLDPG